MAAMMKFACVMLIAAAVVAPPAEAAITCGTVYSFIGPCIPYVTGRGPLGGCCRGVSGLNVAARTVSDRQSVCQCLKSLANRLPRGNLGKAAGLPGQCGVPIPYKISPSTDCSRVT